MIQELVALDVYRIFLTFVRVGGAILVLPGFSATMVPVQVRLLIAVAVSLALSPFTMTVLPPPPDDTGGLFLLLGSELTVGIFVGALAQFLMAAVHFAGTVVSLSASLANAFVYDTVSESQGALVTSFLNLATLTLVFVTGVHILMLEALVQSYSLFVPGAGLPVADMGDSLAGVLGRSFVIGLRLASPFLVYSMVYQTALGITARLMPQLNVFFVALPVQIFLAFAMMVLAVPAILIWQMAYIENGLRTFITGG